MRPELCRELNYMSLRRIALYLGAEEKEFFALYEELLEDQQFLGELNEMITTCRRHYRGGIFRHESVDSVDWFAIQRIALYVLVRYLRPTVCLETGVFYGGTTTFLLHALRKNGHGELISIDLPGQVIPHDLRHHLVGDGEDVPGELDTGFIVHPDQKDRWELIRASSHDAIPALDKTIDLYNHDSDHAFDFVHREMSLVWDKLADNALIMVDDLDWSNGFFSFCVEKKLVPMIMTDNGKSELLARTGLAWLAHPHRRNPDFTG